MRTRRFLAVVVFAAVAGWVVAQPEPAPLPPAVTGAAAPVTDPEVQPAQFKSKQPAPKAPPPAATAPRPVADPPTPVVRIQVRVPADAPPGDDVKVVLTVRNTSTADAHKVTVRNPLPDSVLQVVKAEPKPDEKQSTQRELVWGFGTLKPNETKTIELVVKPKPEAAEVKNLAYVRFEHGEATTTRINKPVVKVTKTAPKSSVRDEPFTVRVVVENAGRVPAEKVRVVENVSDAAEVEAVTAGSKKTGAAQWEWEVGNLMPGQRRVIEYRVTARQGPEALSSTNVSAAKGVLEKEEARTRVLVPALGVKISGPTGSVVPAGESAVHEIVVRNTGTLPSAGIKVAATVPPDCQVTRVTEGGAKTQDGVTWSIPRLEPDEAFAVRVWLRATTTGPRTVRATAADARGMRGADETRTTFQGVASLTWATELNPSYLTAGTRGTLTVRVRNTGGEPARNVKVEVVMPPEVGLHQTTPSVRAGTGPIVFPTEVIAPYGESSYTITYDARQAATAHFRIRLTADALGDRPLVTDKSIEIVGSSK